MLSVNLISEKGEFDINLLCSSVGPGPATKVTGWSTKSTFSSTMIDDAEGDEPAVKVAQLM